MAKILERPLSQYPTFADIVLFYDSVQAEVFARSKGYDNFRSRRHNARKGVLCVDW